LLDSTRGFPGPTVNLFRHFSQAKDEMKIADFPGTILEFLKFVSRVAEPHSES